MKILIPAIGSRVDVQPYLNLGTALNTAGRLHPRSPVFSGRTRLRIG